MMKAVVKGDRPLIMIGLTYGNVAMLKRNKPITFDLAALELPATPVAISYKRPDGLAGFPAEFKGLGFAFSDGALERMKQVPQRMPGPTCDFLFFVAESEPEIERLMRQAGIIGPETRITSDLPPSAKPPLDN